MLMEKLVIEKEENSRGHFLYKHKALWNVEKLDWAYENHNVNQLFLPSPGNFFCHHKTFDDKFS